MALTLKRYQREALAALEKVGGVAARARVREAMVSAGLLN